MVDDFWGPSKRILGDPKFVENMSAFDKDTILPKTAKLVREKYLSNVEANPDKVKSTVPAVDNVTRALFRWVSAIDMYEKVAKNIAPKRDSLARAETDHQVWSPTARSEVPTSRDYPHMAEFFSSTLTYFCGAGRLGRLPFLPFLPAPLHTVCGLIFNAIHCKPVFYIVELSHLKWESCSCLS